MNTLSSMPPEMILFFVAILGLIIGSFLSVVIYRTPIILHQQWQEECQSYLKLQQASTDQPLSLAQPGSHCPQCKQPLKIWQNIPLIGYLVQKGVSRCCHHKIPLRYPILEILTALVCVFFVSRYGLTNIALFSILFITALIALFYIDLDTKLLPDCLTLPLLWMGLLINTNTLFTPLRQAVISAAIGYCSLYVIAQIFLRIRGKQGMGNGDFKMLAMVGAWLGYNAMINTLFFAALIGICCTLALVLCKKIKVTDTIPFGPFLAVSAGLSFLCGPWLLQLFWGA